MKRAKGNMEDFLRDKMSRLDHEYQDDWSVLEQKLERSIYQRQMSRNAIVGGFAILLLGIFIGFHSSDFYILRDHPEKFGPALQRSVPPSSLPAATESVLSTPQPAAASKPLVSSVQSKTIVAAKTLKILPAISEVETPMALISPAETDYRIPAGAQAAVLTLAPRSLPAYQSGFAHAEVKNGEYASAGRGMDLSLSLPANFLGLRMPVPYIGKIVRRTPYVSPLQEKNPWSYSFNVYPNYTFRKFRVDLDKRNLIHNDFIDATQASESGGFSMNFGLEISRRIGHITYLNSGVEFITYKSEVAYDFMNFREANINEAGVIESYRHKEEAQRVSFMDNNNYHYLNIPLSIAYQPWASEHIRLNVEAGASLLYFLNARGRTLNYKTLEVINLADRHFRKSMASFSLKIGASYYVSRKINIGFEPTLRYFTNTIYTEEYPFYVIPYSVGVNFNLQVKLN